MFYIIPKTRVSLIVSSTKHVSYVRIINQCNMNTKSYFKFLDINMYHQVPTVETIKTN